MLSLPFPNDADTPSTLQARRDSLSVSVEGLSRRNEIVLKSSMRVLDHRFLHQWTVVERRGDIRITAQAAGGSPGPETSLRLTSDLIPDTVLVQLPLRARDLESAFNRVGGALVKMRNLHDAGFPRGPRDDEVLRLLKWPSDALLRSAERLTLAAVMSARPCSIETLQGRSALPLESCRAFLRDLMDNGLLRPHTEATVDPRANAHGVARLPWSKSAPAQQGLLARIRARLGLSPNGSR